MPRSLQLRIAIAVGLSVTILWLVAAGFTARKLTHEMDEVFDRGLQATAERLLPLATHGIRRGKHGGDRIEEDDDDHEERVSRLPEVDDDISYIVRDRTGDIILRSDGAADSIYPAFKDSGFQRTHDYRFYTVTSREGVSMTVAEPLGHRAEVARDMLIGLLLPLLIVIPFSLAAILLAVRRGFRPTRTLQQGLEDRGAHDLSPLPDMTMPTELKPITRAINQLLDRLRGAFEAERSFAANAAHELRTPVAGAIAQAQRLKTETADKNAADRAGEIETTLKRLMRMSEKLMQLARAEGSRLQLDTSSDLRPILRLIVEEFERSGEDRITLSLPSTPLLSNLDPDAFGILCRNLIENALRHGEAEMPVLVTLQSNGRLSVSNDGPLLDQLMMNRLTERFERGASQAQGSGLGLAIVKTIADRAGAKLSLISPRENAQSGVTFLVELPSGAD